jgi:hypothetical protein
MLSLLYGLGTQRLSMEMDQQWINSGRETIVTTENEPSTKFVHESVRRPLREDSNERQQQLLRGLCPSCILTFLQ